MDNSNETNWLANYYNRIQMDCKISLERRDRITNWSYAMLVAVVAAYVSFFADGSFVTPLGRFGLVSGALFVLIRFFFASMISYGYFLKGRYFRTMIEQYWLCGKPTMDEIKQDIKKFDHGKSMPETDRNLLNGQIKSGFILILIIPVVILLIEYYLNYSCYYWIIVVLLAAYVFLEHYNFKKYDQIQSAKK